MILFFLIPLFSIFAGDDQYVVYITDDLETNCYRPHVNGCVTDLGVITSNPFQPTPKGCNVLTHEWFHLMGYEENEIPYCIQNQEFRK